ncbi:MAG: class I SAM-dependent methyltransferase [Saprospiraceae bacterium]|nr:class I SAM-dependent methyltransferase [Saprospiraceae bacterium]
MLESESTKLGVYYLSEITEDFESLYLEVRNKEGRLYTDDEVQKLPTLSKTHSRAKEWRFRKAPAEMILNKIRNEKNPLQILDLGCGCGWFTAALSRIPSAAVVGADINEVELRQACRLFQKDNCRFVYWNVFQDDWRYPKFDVITLNSSIQYFTSVPKLLRRLFHFLNPNGQIFILDSPIYKEEEKAPSKERSRRYFESMQVPEMIKHYHHHCWDDFADFEYSILYNPNKIGNRILRKFFQRRSPFYLIAVSGIK